MSLGFRLVIFDHKVQIDRVPIFECNECNYYEVLNVFKEDLLDLLRQLSQQEEGARLYFTEVNELADVMYSLCRHFDAIELSAFEAMLEKNCEERINTLLDLFRCAQKMGDDAWMDEISARLATLSKYVNERQFLNTK